MKKKNKVGKNFASSDNWTSNELTKARQKARRYGHRKAHLRHKKLSEAKEIEEKYENEQRMKSQKLLDLWIKNRG